MARRLPHLLDLAADFSWYLILSIRSFSFAHFLCDSLFLFLSFESIHSRLPIWLKNPKFNKKTQKISKHQPPLSVENLKRMNSGSPNSGSNCSSSTELKTLFFSLLQAVSRVKNNGNNNNNNNNKNTIQI